MTIKSIKIVVQDATYQDISQIIQICESNLMSKNLSKMTASDFSKSGFLMSKLEENHAKNMIDDKEHHIFLIAKQDDEVVGYISACDILKIAEEFTDEISQLKKPILYHKQIAKKPGIIGVGKALIEGLFMEAKNRNYNYILCKIVEEPFLNKASIDFHEKYCFRKIRTVQEKDRVVGIYLRNL